MVEGVSPAQQYGYDVVNESTRRSRPKIELRNEDDIAKRRERDILVSTTRDAKRNFAVAAWMVRKHLDYVSDFTFRIDTTNDAFDAEVTAFMKRWQRRQNCHVARRHPFRRLFRMAEYNRVVDGDTFFELMKSGSLNLIRGDRVRDRFGNRADEWKNGLKINRYGAILSAAVHRRGVGGGFVFDKELSARNFIHHGYFDDSEQFRGVSPLTVAVNTLKDSYESVDFALAKLKAEMILGFALTRKPIDGNNPFQGNKQFDGDDDDEQEANRVDEEKSGLANFGEGIWFQELEEGEDIKSIQGNSPSANAQNFLDAAIHLSLKALDIPLSFWREDFTNFHGARGALQQYKASAKNKQDDNRDILFEITQWIITKAIIDGEIQLPRGWRLDEIDFQWISRGIPWWDRSKEIIGDNRAVAGCFDNPIDICLDHGTRDPFYNIDQTKRVLEYAREHLGEFGVQPSWGTDPSLEEIKDALKEETEE